MYEERLTLEVERLILFDTVLIAEGTKHGKKYVCN